MGRFFGAAPRTPEIAGFVRAVGKVARDAGLVAEGYRVLANVGLNSGQEVPHLHVHIFGGRPLGPDARALAFVEQGLP